MTAEEDAQLDTQDESVQDGSVQDEAVQDGSDDVTSVDVASDDVTEHSSDDQNNSDDLGKASEVLTYVARNIAKEPDAVRVYGTREGNTVNLKVSAAKSDMGRLIGRGGRVANAIRVLVRAAGSLDHLNTNVEFVDN